MKTVNGIISCLGGCMRPACQIWTALHFVLHHSGLDSDPLVQMMWGGWRNVD